jgi:hypothetical protein
MVLLIRLTVAFAVLACAPKAMAQPAQNSEEAAVFIEVHVESFDPAANQRRLTKVAEGSGFLIHRNGWVVTAAHVLNVEVPATARLVLQGSVRSRHTTKFPLEMPPRGVVASDVALLRFPPGLGMNFPYLCVVKHPDIRNTQRIVAVGFPLGFDLSVRPGEVTSLSGPDGLIQTNLGLARGMSGGPILDDHRGVIGIIHGGLEGQNNFDYFTPVNMALPLFDAPPASYVGETCASPQPLRTARTTVERSYQIDETYDDHPSLAPTSKEYRITKNADPGHMIVDARMVRQSDTRVSDLTINISPDRKTVELKFKLTAGPAFDRWRGWLHGQLILTMEPQN